MKNPFNDFDRAFDPMMTDEIVITTKTGETQTLKCFMATDITDAPMNDDLMDTENSSIQIAFNFADWFFVQTKVARGDLVQHMGTGKKYCVTDVKQDFVIGWIIKAKEV